MENGHSEIVEYFLNQHKMDVTQFNDVCNIVAHVYDIVLGVWLVIIVGGANTVHVLMVVYIIIVHDHCPSVIVSYTNSFMSWDCISKL